MTPTPRRHIARRLARTLGVAGLILGVGAAIGLVRLGVLGDGFVAIDPPARPLPVLRANRLDPAGRPVLILAVGTSLTASSGWPEALAARLSACRGAPVVVRKVAQPGAASPWGIEALSAALSGDGSELAPTPASAPAPDLILIEFAINDASLVRGVPLGRSLALHAAMLTRAAASGIPVMLATMNPAFGANALERPGLRAYHGLIRRLAAAYGAGLVDTVPDWMALDEAARAQFIPDGLHPSDAGHDRVTLPAFMAALTPWLCPHR